MNIATFFLIWIAVAVCAALLLGVWMRNASGDDRQQQEDLEQT